MGRPLLFPFFVAAVFAGAHAENRTLGELCTAANDTCVHSSLELACDDVTSRCRIRHGQACSADNSSLCVSGAECAVGKNPSEQLCMCRPPVYTPDTTSGKCNGSTEAEIQEWSFSIGGQVQLGAVAIGGAIEFNSRGSDMGATATVVMMGAILGMLILL